MVAARLIVRIVCVLGALFGSIGFTLLFLGSDPDAGLFFLPVFAVIGTVTMLVAIGLGAWIAEVPSSNVDAKRALFVRLSAVLLTLCTIAAVLAR